MPRARTTQPARPPTNTTDTDCPSSATISERADQAATIGRAAPKPHWSEAVARQLGEDLRYKKSMAASRTSPLGFQRSETRRFPKRVNAHRTGDAVAPAQYSSEQTTRGPKRARYPSKTG